MRNYILTVFVRVCVIIFSLIILHACNSSSSVNQSIESVKALPFTTLDGSSASVNQSALRIEDAWDTPKIVGSETVTATTDALVFDLDLKLDDQGGLLSFWFTHSQFDNQINRYQSTKSTLKKFLQPNSLWETISGTPADGMLPTFHLDKKSGDVYALWQQLNTMNFSRYQGNQWSKPQTLVDAQWGEFVFDDFGDVNIFLVDQQDTYVSISALTLSQALVTSTAVKLQRTNDALIEQLSITQGTNNTSLVVWIEIVNNVSSIWSAEFSVLAGWKNIQEIPITGQTHTAIFQNLTVVVSPLNNNAELFFTRSDTNLTLMAASYRDGNWADSKILVDTQINLSNRERVLSTASNRRGDLAVIWREQQLINTETFQQLKSLSFNFLDDWNLITQVTVPIQASINNKMVRAISETKIAINEIGELSASWIENGQGKSDLLVSHVTALSSGLSTGWAIPELVVSYPSVQSSIISSSIVLGELGKANIVWQQKMKDSINFYTKFWSSTSIGSGKLVEEPLQLLAQPPLRPITTIDIIKPSAIWQAPVEIWTDTILSNTASLVHGPHIKNSDAGTGFVSLLKSMDFNPLTGGYLFQESVVLNSTTPGDWTLDQPFPATSGTTNDEINIKISPSGDAFALWLVDGTLYFNHFTVVAGWGTETNLGLSNAGHDIMFDTANNVWVFWVLGNDINLQQYIPGTGVDAGFQTLNMTSIPSAWYFAAPVIDSTGTINVTWISLPGLGSQPFTNTNDLNLINFTPAATVGDGWGFVEIAPPLNSFNAMTNELTLLKTINDEVMAVSQDSHGNIFAITFSGTNGWGTWENLDFNLSKNDAVADGARVVSNGENNIMVIWSEETTDIDGALIYRIYSNRYDPIGDEFGSHWPLPERVGAVVPQFDAAGNDIIQFQTLPNIALLADGQAFAVWLDSSELNSALYANQYTPGTSWGNTPDQVISYDRLLTGVVKSPSVQVLEGGKITLSWRQDIATEFANEIHVWVTEGQL